MYLRIENHLICQWYTPNFFVSILLILAICIQAKAQNEVDFNKYPKSVHDSLYYELFKTHYSSDKNLARSYAIKSLELSRKHDKIEVVLKSLNALGILYEGQNNHDSALFYHNQAMEIGIQQNKLERLMYTYCNLGIVYLNLGVIDQSLDYSLKSLKIARDLNQTAIQISALHNIGFAYGKINNNSEALSYYEESLKLMTDADVNSRSQTKINIAFTYINLKKYQEAITIFKEIVDDNESEGLTTEAYYGLADAFLNIREVTESKKYIQQAMFLSQKGNDQYFLAKSYNLAGHIFYIEKNYEQAVKNLNEGLLIAKEIKSTLAAHDLYELLSKVYFDQGEFKKSSLASNQAHALKDSLFNEKFAENFKNVHLKIEKEKSDAIILSKEAQIERQRVIVISATIITILALLVVIILWRMTIIIKRSRDMQTDANKIIEKQNKDLTRLCSVVETLMEERTLELRAAINNLSKTNNQLDNFIFRFSQDVRVPLASLRTIYDMGISSTKDPVALKYFSQLEDVANKFSLVFNLFLVLDDIDRTPAVNEKIQFEELIREIIDAQRRKGIPEKIEIDVLVAPLINFHSDMRAMRLILSTLINNAIKFYDPSESVHSTIDIKVYQQNGNLKISVADNGIGIDQSMKNKIFQVPDISSPSGISLHLTKRACERLSGNIQVTKTPEGYTEFVIILPLPRSIVESVKLN